MSEQAKAGGTVLFTIIAGGLGYDFGKDFGIANPIMGVAVGALLGLIFGWFLVVVVILDILLHVVIGLPVTKIGGYESMPHALSITFHVISAVVGIMGRFFGQAQAAK